MYTSFRYNLVLSIRLVCVCHKIATAFLFHAFIYIILYDPLPLPPHGGDDVEGGKDKSVLPNTLLNSPDA